MRYVWVLVQFMETGEDEARWNRRRTGPAFLWLARLGRLALGRPC